jgi:protein-disulfide isomerase
VIEFVDYECPACRAIETGLRKANNPRLRVRIYQYPLTEIHPKAMNAARAAVCAKAQGSLASIHPIMMSAPLPEKLTGFRDIAGEASVPDVDGFFRCLHSQTSIELVERDREFGRRLGVRGTPSFFAVSGEPLSPSQVAKLFP